MSVPQLQISFCLRAYSVVKFFGEASLLTSTLDWGAGRELLLAEDWGAGRELLLADYAGALWKFLFARGWTSKKFLEFHT